MSKVVYPRAVCHQGVTYDVVVHYRGQQVAQPSQDFFQTEAGRAQLKKMQSLVSVLYGLGDQLIQEDPAHKTAASHRYLEQTVFKYSPTCEHYPEDSEDPSSKTTMHTFGQLDLKESAWITTPLDRTRIRDPETIEILQQSSSGQKDRYSVEDLIQTIARVALEPIFVGQLAPRSAERREPLPPLEIRLVRQKAQQRPSPRSHGHHRRSPSLRSQRSSDADEESEQE